MAKPTEYEVYGRVAGVFSANVTASSLEEARAKAAKLNLDDFIEIYGQHLDSDFRVIGVHEREWDIR